MPSGAWKCHHGDVSERIMLRGNVTELSLTWSTSASDSRKLDWSWGGHENIFTLAGGDDKKILRWRPSVRHILFDDDHVVWTPYNTQNKSVAESRGVIVYTRERRTLVHFKDVHPSDWCAS